MGIQGNIVSEKLIKSMKDLKNLESLESIHHKWEFLICLFSSVKISNLTGGKHFLITLSEASILAMSKSITSFPDKSASEGTI